MATHDIEPYLAKTGTGDETVVLGYYGSPGVPGFGFSASTPTSSSRWSSPDADDGDPVACGDILEPDADRFGEAGVAVVQLLPVGSIRRARGGGHRTGAAQRELDVTPTRVRVIAVEREPTSATTGHGGRVRRLHPRRYVRVVQATDCACSSRATATTTSNRSSPRPADPASRSPSPTTGRLACRGSALAAAYTDQAFSLVVTDTETGDPVACGDILEPDDDDFTEAGSGVGPARSRSATRACRASP